MKITPMAIPEVLLIEPDVFRDERGFLLESWQADRYGVHGIGPFVQDNHSRSGARVLRGLHHQTHQPSGKLVRCLRGAIWDVAVDLRAGSPTFRRWVGHELSDANHAQMWVPPGFAHGFCVLGDVADVEYKLTTPYDPGSQAGVRWDDPSVGIEWPISHPLLSVKDASWPLIGP